MSKKISRKNKHLKLKKTRKSYGGKSVGGGLFDSIFGIFGSNESDTVKQLKEKQKKCVSDIQLLIDEENKKEKEKEKEKEIVKKPATAAETVPQEVVPPPPSSSAPNAPPQTGGKKQKHKSVRKSKK